MNYDVAIIGAGPGGYVAAIKAAQLGAKVALIEKDQLGGTCLNYGCIPTKTILKSVEKYKELKECKNFGIIADNIGFDFTAIMQRKNSVTKQLRDGIATILKSYAIDVITGSATLQKDKQIIVAQDGQNQTINAQKIIIATGSSPIMPPIEGINLDGVLDSDKLLELDKVPESLVIIGGGVIGIEFATVFQNLGCQVTVVEMLPNILNGMDKDIVMRSGISLRKQGIKFLTSSAVKKIANQGQMLSCSIESATEVQEVLAEKVLVCTGRKPNIHNIGLENLSVEFDKKGIYVDESLQTNIEGVFAIGDVTGKSMLAHSASVAGIVAAQNACGQKVKMNFDNIPGCIFTMPEIASVGFTEGQAKDSGMDIVVSKFNFAGIGKAVAIGQTDGLVKIVADSQSHIVLGMHIMGYGASSLIMEGVVAISNKLTAEQIAHSVHPHPTLSEAVLECAEGIFGQPIHQMKMKK